MHRTKLAYAPARSARYKKVRWPSDGSSLTPEITRLFLCGTARKSYYGNDADYRRCDFASAAVTHFVFTSRDGAIWIILKTDGTLTVIPKQELELPEIETMENDGTEG